MTQFENRNSYRNYPFSSTSYIIDNTGAEFPSDVFVDAVVYPIMPKGRVMIDKFDSAVGEIKLSDEGKTLFISGTESSGKIELFQDGGHVGTIVCGDGFERERSSGRKWEFRSAFLSSSCVVPVVGPRVMSIQVEGSGEPARSHIIGLYGSGRLWTTEGTTSYKGEECGFLRFDVKDAPRTQEYDKKTEVGVRRIIVATEEDSILDFGGGNNVTREFTLGAAGVVLYIPNMSREDVCYNANRGEAASELVDTCSPDPQSDDCVVPVPHGRPKEKQVSAGWIGVHFSSSDSLGYRNPVRVSTISGSVVPNVPSMEPMMDIGDAMDEVKKLTQASLGFGNGILIEIPGSTVYKSQILG